MDPELAARMGLRVRRARLATGWRQADLAEAAGVSQSTISRMELGAGVRTPFDTWTRVAAAAGLDVTVDFRPTSVPRDDLTQQQMHRLVVARALAGGWTAWTRHDETILQRSDRCEAAIVHVWDVIGDVGAAIRALERRIETEQTERGDAWRVRGFVVILASGHNRRRATESGALMNRAFTVRGGSWLVALGGGPMPKAMGMLWTGGRLERLRPFLPYLDHRLRQRRRSRRPR
jgi:transcriptional regulator with XRE-family HTH domain